MSDLIVVDVETSGLDPDRHVILEVAAVNVETGDSLYFVPAPPCHGPYWMSVADPEALSVNRFFERRLHKACLSGSETTEQWRRLTSMLEGSLLAGVNPWFDLRFIRAALSCEDIEHNISHRVRDLATYTSGVLGLDPSVSWSAADIFDMLGVTNDAPHTALGDARATAEAFTELSKIVKDRVVAS